MLTLTLAVGWISAASLWNPFLAEGPPLGLPSGAVPGYLGKGPGSGVKTRGGGGGGDIVDRSAPSGNLAQIANGGVAVSVGGMFSPTPQFNRRAGAGRTPG